MNEKCIEKPIHELVWPWYKFFSEASEREMEWKIISNVFNVMQPKFVGSQEECQQWKVDHTNIMSVTFNSMKNYAISRIKEAVEKYYHENNHTMPSKELLLACGDRTIDMGDNPESTPPEPNLKQFVFYWDKLLPPAYTAPTVDSWGKETRYYTKLSPKNKAITAPDEAFLCLCIDNYWARWEKIFELKGANPGCKVKSTATKPRHLPTNTTNQEASPAEDEEEDEYYVDTTDKKAIYLWGEYNGNYTITNSGSGRSGGWSVQGKAAFNSFWKKVKTGRKHPDTPAKEHKVYDFLRSANHISAKSAEDQRLRQKRAESGKIVPHKESYADSDNSDAEQDGDHQQDTNTPPAGSY
jgi:hypothetical protein